MKWLEVYDPDQNERPMHVLSDSVEMILPFNDASCYVTLKERSKQWRVKMSAKSLIAWIG